MGQVGHGAGQSEAPEEELGARSRVHPLGPSWQAGHHGPQRRDGCCTIILFQTPRPKGLDSTA